MRPKCRDIKRRLGRLYTVSLAGKSAMRTRSQPFNLATVVSNARLSDREKSATTKPQRADQVHLDRTRMRLRLSQQFIAGAPSPGKPSPEAERLHCGSVAEAVKLTLAAASGRTAVAELNR